MIVMEPAQLKRGRKFQKMVQVDYKKNSENEGEGVEIEEDVIWKMTIYHRPGIFPVS